MNENKGRILDLARLLEIQEGAVVSRELLSLKTGTITVFAFDRNQGLSEHTAPFDATVLGLEGEAEITIADTVHRLKKGELLIMPAHRPHALTALSPFKMLLIMIRT